MANLLPGLLFAASLLLFTIRLDVPARYMFDEVYHAYTAGQYVQGNPDAFIWSTKAPRQGVAYMWNHPPAGVLLIAAGIALWGNNPFGWRFSSALFGAIGIVVAYLLAVAVTRRSIALLTASFLMMDGLYFAQSRIGMLDIFGVVFMMCAFWAFYAYLTSPADRIRRPLLLTGVFLGLAIATKWNAGFPAFFIGLVVLGRAGFCLRAVRRKENSGARSAVRQHLIWVPIALFVCPLLIYLASYAPLFLAGHDWSDFVVLQKQIFYYHSHLEASHPYQSSWWQWPLALRPVWYSVTRWQDTIANVYANGNPLLYWALVPAVAWVAWMWRKGNGPALIVLLVGFFGQWLPWAAVQRISFAYHFLPAVPFGCLALAFSLAKLAGRNTAGKVVAGACVVLILLAFLFFYPIHASVPLSREALAMRMWFDNWR